jgi:hypothetical protein
MKKLQLKSWVQTLLIMWTGIDFVLIALALYMSRILEIGL